MCPKCTHQDVVNKTLFKGVVMAPLNLKMAKPLVLKVKSGGKSCLNVHNTNKSHFRDAVQLCIHPLLISRIKYMQTYLIVFSGERKS